MTTCDPVDSLVTAPYGRFKDLILSDKYCERDEPITPSLVLFKGQGFMRFHTVVLSFHLLTSKLLDKKIIFYLSNIKPKFSQIIIAKTISYPSNIKRKFSTILLAF